MSGLSRWLRQSRVWVAVGLAFLVLQPVRAIAGGPVVVKADLDGAVNTITAGYVDQVVKRAESERARAVVLLMNTPGGDSISMDRIVTTILNSKVPVIAYVYPAGARADSAGLFVAQAADLVAMAPGTNLGSAHPIQATGSDITGDLGKKVLNDAVARIRNLASVHGRNGDWCEQAVRESVNINADQAVVLHVADLTAGDLPFLLQAVDGRALHRPDGSQARLELAGATVEDNPMTWVQQALHALIDPNVAYLLFLLAIFGVLVELTTPGAILPGVVGVISGIVALVALTGLPINLGGVLLILFAFGLFVADLKAPTHGILTAGGVIALMLGSALLINTGPIGLGVSPWLIVGGAAVSLGLFGFVLRKAIAARSRPAFVGEETLIGAVGKVRESLDPQGMVFVDGALWRASTVAGPIPTGREVRVVARQGLELEVVPFEAPPTGVAGRSPPSQSHGSPRRAKRTQGIKSTEAH
jgi:membrane-bound serine protease (ClpP class)